MKYNNKKLEQNFEDELVSLIDARYLLFQKKHNDEALELALELGFDKEELLT
tara:strand:+ start:257 stop:412 length:156 start_codon:yes stop_codon:yes gene_type:complete